MKAEWILGLSKDFDCFADRLASWEKCALTEEEITIGLY